MSPSYASRFDATVYADDERVEVRAYRGSQEASIYRECWMPDALFSRMVTLGHAYDLHALLTLEVYDTGDYSKPQARGMSDDLAFLATVINDPLLEPHLADMRSVADSCWRTTQHAWLVIEGP